MHLYPVPPTEIEFTRRIFVLNIDSSCLSCRRTTNNRSPFYHEQKMSDTTKKARDTLSSIYSFYEANKDTLERAPSFLSDTSRDIQIGLRSSVVPSAEQTEELKKDLRELVKTKEALGNIPAAELQLMMEAANASTIRRKQKK
ncbi:uncharacterized protein F5Z01DRAFT_643862 [Emericellopsis atlantica]|uniref:Uncharacterized protein n=1 Tax=Emericellopsis atlantica TaxID=2614577 RepID=A0A9P7ZVM6_9HYPO|nr:uncharacterized protein F5Z01DRAFT_643862 [Emericellopsis atlantica]KAG9258666.1 hypothetical protein F5Z01DRAFT_643862 [Emericellopsis atlantica]